MEEAYAYPLQLGNGFHWFVVTIIVSLLLFLLIVSIAMKGEIGPVFMLGCCCISSMFGFTTIGFPREVPPLGIKIFMGLIVACFLWGFYEWAQYHIQRRRRRREIHARRAEQ